MINISEVTTFVDLDEFRGWAEEWEDESWAQEWLEKWKDFDGKDFGDFEDAATEFLELLEENEGEIYGVNCSQKGGVVHVFDLDLKDIIKKKHLIYTEGVATAEVELNGCRRACSLVP
jgi:hypothetical protein